MMIGKFDLVIATCFNLLLTPLKLQIVLLCITKARKHIIRVTSIVNFSNVQNNYLRTCYYDDFVFAPLAVTAKQHLGAQSHNCHLNGHATILSGAEGNPRTYFILVPINKSITCNMRFDSMNINIFESYW